MNLCELYALTSGAKLKKPKLPEKYYPLIYDKYITFSPLSKPAKNYDRWQDVLDILAPILQKNNIKILQLGDKNEPAFEHCIHFQGATSFPQVFYILKNSLLHLSTDTFTIHAAGIYDIPIVALFSNNYAKNTKSYWATKQICIEPPRAENEKPSFALDEGPNKQINRIKPEEIARAVCKQLNLEYNFPYKYTYFGESYHAKIVEMIPTHPINISQMGIDSIIVRMDYLFNEQNLIHQLQTSKCSIVTNKPINIEIITQLKQNIKEIIYVIEKNNSPDFVKKIQKLGIPFHLISYLSDEEIRAEKLNYYDYGVIIPKKIRTAAEIDELKDKNNLYFKTHKWTIANGKVYPSIYHYLKNEFVGGFSSDILEIKDKNSKYFWRDLEYFSILEKTI